MAARASSSKNTETGPELVCPECGRTFARPAALGAHRRAAHGVAGASRGTDTSTAAGTGRDRSPGRGQPSRRTRSASSTGTGTRSRPADSGQRGDREASGPSVAERTQDGATAAAVDRDALLQALFPQGIPAREHVLRGINSWLDEAERLARMR